MKQNGKVVERFNEKRKIKIKKDKKEEQKEKAKQNEWRIKISLNNLKKTKESQPEFKYIDEVPKENLQGNRILSIPENVSINNDGRLWEVLSYTNRQYLKETKRLKYHALLKTIKTNRNYQGRGRT
jgi:phosphoketolase